MKKADYICISTYIFFNLTSSFTRPVLYQRQLIVFHMLSATRDINNRVTSWWKFSKILVFYWLIQAREVEALRLQLIVMEDLISQWPKLRWVCSSPSLTRFLPQKSTSKYIKMAAAMRAEVSLIISVLNLPNVLKNVSKNFYKRKH